MNALSLVVLLVAVAATSASILTAPGAIIAPSGAIIAGRGAIAAGPLGLSLASPLGLGLARPLGLGLGHLGLAAPLGVRVTATNLRVAPAGAPVGVLVPAGNGLEGQWVPEISEKLHDDGSYKPEIYGA